MGERRRPRPFWYLRRKPEAVASEIDDELRVHLEMRVDELAAGGMPAEDARREALRQFGDLEQTRAYCRREDERREDRVQLTLMLQDFAQDARIAIRSLLRTPVLALTIVLTVGLGICATTAIFCAVNATLLRPLPYQAPERLVRIYTDTPPFVSGSRQPTTWPWWRSRRNSRKSPRTRAAHSRSATASRRTWCRERWCRGPTSTCSGSGRPWGAASPRPTAVRALRRRSS